jgi:hypothetical protein
MRITCVTGLKSNMNDLEKSRAELHEMHLAFMSTIADFIDALNSYFEDLYGLGDKK